ncbi:5'-methylthioadenosine/S-adenosylhomocysteine nucleosidase [termite gut metagenome]|jgi:nucleoside phosphorylase|uniref:5'-methylthioadenosine/S-adenosylhomocysteine nucleosidase n=1 Tax=termite gut metagenome TaxID=433724 RepID=A0A5J4RIZ4_9ZZZZ
MKRILFVTALQLEFDAVKSYLTNVVPVKHPDTGTYYDKGLFGGNDMACEVFIVEAGAGNSRSAEETSRAISFFKPDYAFFIGVAGGIKDVDLGDVVVSTKVIGYEMGKADNVFKPRHDTFQSSYELEQLAKHVSRERLWSSKFSTHPKSFVAPIAAGEKVVSSIRAETYNHIKTYVSDALAVEMEGAGFLEAIRVHSAQGIIIRGISDLLEHKEAADNSGSQAVAANNAAAFVFQMVAQLIQTPESLLPNLNDLRYKNKLVDKLSSLYEKGPEDNDIWKRAGGNVSILTNDNNRKSQWYSAIDSLSKGGGGNITLLALIEEVKKDYPNFSYQF